MSISFRYSDDSYWIPSLLQGQKFRPYRIFFFNFRKFIISSKKVLQFFWLKTLRVISTLLLSFAPCQSNFVFFFPCILSIAFSSMCRRPLEPHGFPGSILWDLWWTEWRTYMFPPTSILFSSVPMSQPFSIMCLCFIDLLLTLYKLSNCVIKHFTLFSENKLQGSSLIQPGYYTEGAWTPSGWVYAFCFQKTRRVFWAFLWFSIFQGTYSFMVTSISTLLIRDMRILTDKRNNNLEVRNKRCY